MFQRIAHREADPELAAACRPCRPNHASTRGGEDDSEGVEREHFQPTKSADFVLDGSKAAAGVRLKQSVDGVGLATERVGDGDGGVYQSIGMCTERGDDNGGWGMGCAAVLSNDSDFMVMDIPGCAINLPISKLCAFHPL